MAAMWLIGEAIGLIVKGVDTLTVTAEEARESLEESKQEYNDIKTVSDLWNKLSYNQLSRDEYYNKNPDNLLKVDNTRYFKNSFEKGGSLVFICL